jgi:hypothetical protein
MSLLSSKFGKLIIIFNNVMLYTDSAIFMNKRSNFVNLGTQLQCEW